MQWISTWQLKFTKQAICLERQGEGETIQQAKEAACEALMNAPEVHSLVYREFLFQRPKSNYPSDEPFVERPGESQCSAQSIFPTTSVSAMVSILDYICQKQSWKRVFKVLEAGMFRVSLEVEGVPIATGCGRTIKEAENEAAKKALEHSFLEADLTADNFGLNAEIIERLCEDKFQTLVGNSLQLKMALFGNGAVFSCIVRTSQRERSRTEIVALASGSKIFSGDSNYLDGARGTVLTDCHAEILARRAFGAYLHDQAVAALKSDQEESMDLILQMDPSTGKLRLKDGINFHLYVSAPPCGDVTILTATQQHRYFSPDREGEQGGREQGFQRHWAINNSLVANDTQPVARKTCGLLRCKVPGSEADSDRLLEEMFAFTRSDSQKGLRKMCCSDKLAMWNCVGIQGALFSMVLTKPIFLSSMIIGGGPLYCHGALSRAVCCRMGRQCQPEGVTLNEPYKLNHPTLVPVQGYAMGRHGQCSSALSMNWFKLILKENHPELVDGSKGVPSPFQVSGSPNLTTSRLCKASKWQRFKEMSGAYPSLHASQLQTYGATKKSSEGYQRAKKAVRGYFLETTPERQEWSKRSLFLPNLEDF